MSGAPSRPEGRARALLFRGWPLLVLLLLTAAFFWPFFSAGKVFLASDNLYGFYPWRHYAPPGFRPHNTLITDPINGSNSLQYNRQLKEGRLWGWSPLVSLGGPATLTVSQGAPGRWYPPKLLAHRLFSATTAFTVLLMLHVFMMGAFMLLYLRRIGAGLPGALFGSVAYMLNGCAMVWLSFETVVPVGAMLPLLLLCCEGFLGQRRALWTFGAAGTLGVMLVMGHFQYVLYTGMLLVLLYPFIAWRAWKPARSWREVGAVTASFAVTGALGLLIGAVEILPMREAVELSSRVERTFTFTGLFETLGRVPAQWWATLVFPDYFGSPVLGFGAIPSNGRQEYMNYNELTLYLGVPTLFALAAAPFALRNLHARFYAALALLLAAMLMGSPVFWPFFALFPGMDRLNPTRMIFPFVFAATVAAAFGVGAIDGLSRRHRVWLGGIFAVLAAAVAALAAISSSPEIVHFFFGPLQASPASESAYLSLLAGKRALSSPIILKPLMLTAAAGALFALYACYRRSRAVTWAAGALLLVLLAYDLISFGWYYNGATEPRHLYPRTPSIDFLLARPGPFRVLQDAGRGLYVNTLAPFGIEEVGGYTNVYPNRVNKLLSFIELGDHALRGPGFDRWVMFRTLAHPLFNLLNVRYVLSAPGVRIDYPGYSEVFRGDLTIYENLRAMPRVFAVHRATVIPELPEAIRWMGSERFDPATEVVLEQQPPPGFAPAAPPPPGSGAVTIERYGSDEIAVRADLAANGWIVVSNAFFPGWSASVDGSPAPVLAADAALQAVAVPRGSHRVVFRFEPQGYKHGLRLTLLGVLLALAGIAGALVAGRRRARQEC